MKRFLTQILIYFIIFLGLSTALDLIITNNLYHSKTRMLTAWNDIYFSDIRSDVVIMGSSRAFVQYDPHIIDSVLGVTSYNLGVDGRGIDAQVIRYHSFCRRQGVPKKVILNIDIFALDCSAGYEREQFLPYFFDSKLRNEVNNIEHFTIADNYLPLWRYAGYYQMIKEGLGLPNKMAKVNLYKGFESRNAGFDRTTFDQIDSISFTKNNLAYAILDNFLGECESNNVDVVMVLAPIYYGIFDKYKSFYDASKFYNNIAAEHNVPLLDYTFDQISYSEDNFYNATHLNAHGAYLFSYNLANDLLGMNE